MGVSHYAVLTANSLDICDGCYGTVVASSSLDATVTKDKATQVRRDKYIFRFYNIHKQLLHHCDHVILVLARTVYNWNVVLPMATSLSRVLGKGKRLGERPLLNMPPWKRARKVRIT